MTSALGCISDQEGEPADKILNELCQPQVEHPIDLEDACVVVRDESAKFP